MLPEFLNNVLLGIIIKVTPQNVKLIIVLMKWLRNNNYIMIEHSMIITRSKFGDSIWLNKSLAQYD